MRRRQIVGADQQVLAQLLAAAQAGKLDRDVTVRLLIVAHRPAGQVNHPLGQIENPHRLAHIE